MKNVDATEESKSSKKYDEYEMNNWVDTLQRAEEIKSDPAKMKALGPLIRKKMKAFKSIQDLEDYANEKTKYEDE